MRQSTAKRYAALLDLLRRNGPLSIPAIAKKLAREDSVVRTDLMALLKSGKVGRTEIYVTASHGRGRPSTVGWRTLQ